jgi:hypothetical protein
VLLYYDVKTTAVNFSGAAEGAVNDYYSSPVGFIEISY